MPSKKELPKRKHLGGGVNIEPLSPEVELSGIFLVLTTALISGFSIFINKIGVQGVNPYVLTGSKNFLVAIFIFGLILTTGKIKSLKGLKVKDWSKLFLIGLIGGCLPFLLFFKGLSLTSAAQAALIHKNLFLIATPLALFFLKEKVSRRFFLAALFLLTGNLLFFRVVGFHLGLGDLLILLATTLWAAENIISKKALKSLPAKTVAFGRMFFGSILIGGFLLFSGQGSQLGQLSLTQVSWIILTSVLLLGYVLTWYTGLRLVRVSLATSVLALGSPVTAFLSTTLLGNFYSLTQIFGLIFLFVGIGLIVRQKGFSLSKLKKLANVRT
jgi:drug/metabolite transporter (DMT)-like permease